MDIGSRLPTELNSFVGRERELDELRKLMCAARMVTLTGPGGIGKTRLALRTLATIADDYPDGACYVELAEVTSPDTSGLSTLGRRNDVAKCNRSPF